MFSLLKRLFSTEPGDDPEATSWTVSWERAANELGLQGRAQARRGRLSDMRGEIDGHRTKVRCLFGGQPEIEVDFTAGVRDLSIRPANTAIKTNRTAVPTGDQAFDAALTVYATATTSTEVLEWLTAERRRALLALANSVQIEEIEEDEIEAHLSDHHGQAWTSEDLVAAVRRCVRTAVLLEAQPRGVFDQPPTEGYDGGPQDTISGQ